MNFESYFFEKKAVIFDMDGVMVNSNSFWKQAELEIFSKLGVTITEELSALTESMTTREVINFWYMQYPWDTKSFDEVEKDVIHRVIELIRETDCTTIGIKSFIKNLKERKFKIGLATNSPKSIIPVVLEKTDTKNLFDIVSSADSEIHGKPNPDIYLNTAKKLNVLPKECIVIEDSIWGIEAAKAAGMTVVGFAADDNEQLISRISDFTINNFKCENLIFP